MKIKQFSFRNYRNLKNNAITPCEGVNVICGDNAQGKTNFLEGLWIFSGGKSFRGVKDADLVAFGEKTASLNMDVFTQERPQNIQIDFIQKKRTVHVNKVKLTTPSELIGKVCAVAFSPAHLALIREGPSLRRKFIDSALCQIRPLYTSSLLKYNHILLQRNFLLRAIKKDNFLTNTLDIWEENLAESGAKIIAERLAYIAKLKTPALAFYRGLSSERENLSMQYKPTVGVDLSSSKEEIKAAFLKVLAESRNDDISFGFTTKGPHRDDLELKVDGKPARTFASQGQQRSVVLALKLAEADIVCETIQESPIILLDDVLSELDESRQSYILNQIKEKQVFITCCGQELNEKLSVGKLFNVSRGEIKEQN